MLRRFQAARREEPMRLLARWPFLRRPRCWRPAEVRPRHSLCFITGLVIHWMRGSLRMAWWEGSTVITCGGGRARRTATVEEPHRTEQSRGGEREEVGIKWVDVFDCSYVYNLENKVSGALRREEPAVVR